LLGLARLMRPRQWIKNLFVLAPLVFAAKVQDFEAVQAAVTAAILFCVASSIVYIINDIRDISVDRAHPIKSRTRPLAAGDVTVPQAIVLLGVLLMLLGAGLYGRHGLVEVLVAYVVLNLGYTFVFKNKPVADLFVIAFGFVMRVYAGAVAISVSVSSWMFITTLTLALYLAAIKRRQELLKGGEGTRRVLERYSVALVDRYAEMSATGAMLFYSLYVMSERPELVVSIPLVLYGLFRYWYVVDIMGGGESPTDALFMDWQLPAVVVAWVAVCSWLLVMG